MAVWIHGLRYYRFAPRHVSAFLQRICQLRQPLRLHRSFHSRLPLSSCVPTFLTPCGTGISTCCPSATPPGLALGPDLPRADQLYPGILGYSAVRILTLLSLLIPAFSLHRPPLLFTVQLRRSINAPLPPILRMDPRLRCRVSAPDIFGAGPLDQ